MQYSTYISQSSRNTASPGLATGRSSDKQRSDNARMPISALTAEEQSRADVTVPAQDEKIQPPQRQHERKEKRSKLDILE